MTAQESTERYAPNHEYVVTYKHADGTIGHSRSVKGFQIGCVAIRKRDEHDAELSRGPDGTLFRPLPYTVDYIPTGDCIFDVVTLDAAVVIADELAKRVPEHAISTADGAALIGPLMPWMDYIARAARLGLPLRSFREFEAEQETPS